ncbi:MAG: PRC-barrel domain-containing protein [Spirochaetia bacterium]|jgi:sporulation protein YlmC with PRC-barrel domain|nr:PRC-barrel domain-containing protein [Spirochaetia bacterium]
MLRNAATICNSKIVVYEKKEGTIDTLIFNEEEFKISYLAVQEHTGKGHLLIKTSSRLDLELSEYKMNVALADKDLLYTTIGEGYSGAGTSIDKLLGLIVFSAEGRIGVVANVVIDDKTWDIRYLIVTTDEWINSNQLPIEISKTKDINISEGYILIDSNFNDLLTAKID